MESSSINPFAYFSPVEVLFGPGRLEELSGVCARLGRKPLIVAGMASARTTGLLERVMGQLPGAQVFEGVGENPSTELCDCGAEQCRRNGCDLVVAVGGGSPIDVAKAIAGLAKNQGACADYFGRDKFSTGALPIVAIPTTAGSGSEVTPYAVIVDAATNTKRTIAGRDLFPAIALLDPELTLTMPVAVTRSTGLDVLSQAMEGIVSKASTPVGNLLALEAIRIVRRELGNAIRDGGDLEARGAMLYAAMLAGCVIAQSGTTIIHGMGYQYTLDAGVPHGLANALLLAPVFQFNARYVPRQVESICEALGVTPAESAEASGRLLGGAIHSLLEETGVSAAARESGVSQERLSNYADDVASDPYRYRNQVGEISRDTIYHFYELSYHGRLD